MIESQSVFDAMIAYGKILIELEKNISSEPSELQPLSYKLAWACRCSLSETWEPVELDDIPWNRKSNAGSSKKNGCKDVSGAVQP
ncbi:MAG: hypothetical protein HRT37_13475 [Alteromonadaceae bacterium]|nr:hypothetical protein [Alteromonadaceae bacterium]